MGHNELLDMYRRIPQICPPCMLASGKTGKGAYMWDCDISVWQPLPTNECNVGIRFLHFPGCLMEKNDKVSHNMTQIASVLAVAAVFIGLWTVIAIFFSQRSKGGRIAGHYMVHVK